MPSARRALLCASAALLAGLAACRPGHGGNPSITVRELRTHVAILTSERLRGRLAGTPGYDSAAAYAARALEGAGVKAVASDSGRAGYYQAIRMIRQRIGGGTALELSAGGRTSRVAHGPRTFLLLSAGAAARAAPLRPPVFVGAGLHAPEYGIDDLAGLDLAGRAALLTAMPPRADELARLPRPVARLYEAPGAAQTRRFTDLVQRGAAAILLLPDRWLVDEWEAISAKQRRVYDHPAEPLAGTEPEPPIPVALLHADLVDRLFLDRGYHPISHAGRYHTFVLADVALRLIPEATPDSFVAANVIGVVRGRDRTLRDEYVVVGAQLDGKGTAGDGAMPGAQDAAACAALLEAAAATAARPTRRSVVFVLFTAEAGGRWGSRYFVKHPPLPGGRMVAAVAVGHVGEASEPAGVVAYTTGRLIPSVRAVAGEADRDRMDVRDVRSQPGALKGSPGASFDEVGIPTVLLTRAAGPGSSSPRDDVAHVDWPRLRDAARLLHALTAKLGDARTLGTQEG